MIDSPANRGITHFYEGCPMVKLLIRFWPLGVLLLLVLVWWLFVVRYRRKRGALISIHPWEKRAWTIAISVTFVGLVAIILTEVIAEPAHRPNQLEHYVSPTLHEGQIVPGHMER